MVHFPVQTGDYNFDKSPEVVSSILTGNLGDGG